MSFDEPPPGGEKAGGFWHPPVRGNQRKPESSGILKVRNAEPTGWRGFPGRCHGEFGSPQVQHKETAALPTDPAGLVPGRLAAVRGRHPQTQGFSGAAFYVPWAIDVVVHDERRQTPQDRKRSSAVSARRLGEDGSWAKAGSRRVPRLSPRGSRAESRLAVGAGPFRHASERRPSLLAGGFVGVACQVPVSAGV